ncbi:hypothetical protein G7A66_08830 [Altererythrobacter sp. SALINAS58]|uniref:DUF5710 domain-containing protein n=1 Tax=Alteripontixanthobacter muriae TaxID=2705546 RepID=UPI001576A9D4|nr:DUF5710 domain-containing protein [Alteripontixanthobacter muriae]NTZ43193.1 hypothetical protein [Alteripontixanthobacter muriae]
MAIPDDQPNIFQMYVAHGKAGFWLRRTTWDATCAKVVAVGELSGCPPYYGNPPVLADIYSLDGKLKEELARIPASGTYKTWRQIAPPDWAAHAIERNPDSSEIKAALGRHGHRQEQAGNAAERVALSVPFARKDEAKELGARWDASQKVWWIADSEVRALQKASELGFLPDSGS